MFIIVVIVSIDCFGGPLSEISLAHGPSRVRVYHYVIVDVRGPLSDFFNIHVLLVEFLL